MRDPIERQEAIGGTTLEESVKALQSVFVDHDIAEKGETEDMMIKAGRCPKCYGRLTYEEIGSYGDTYDIGVKTGRPLRKRKERFHYNHEDSMVYCMNCGKNYEFEYKEDGIYIIFGAEEDEEEDETD